MPFQFTPYSSPLTASIADRLAQQGAIEAQRAYATGNAAANAAQQSGNAWAGAIRGVGDVIGNLPRQIEGVKAAEQNRAIGEQRLQAGALELGQAQRTEQTAQTIDQYKARVAELASDPTLHNEDGTLNADALVGHLGTLPGGAAGPTRPVDREALGKVLTPINTGITEARDAKLKWEDTKTNALARIAAGAYRVGSQTGNYIQPAQLGLATALKSGLVTQDEANAFLVPMVEHPDRVPSLLQGMVARSTLPPIKLGKEETLLNPLDPSQVLAKGADAPPTEAQLALKAAGGDPTATKAMGLLKPPPPPRPIEEQLLEAIANGDTTKATQIKETLRASAAARQDPAAATMARELGGLRADEARARLEALKAKNEPVDITPDVQTTTAGRTYVDLSTYTGEARNKARDAANAAGAVPVSKEQANALQEIDNARANQQAINNQIKDLLPTGPGARGVATVAVPLQKLFQSNDQVAAFNSWRTAAIQTLRATAGSKGLRINEAEIAQAIENDIPRLTDTVGTAQQKLQNINTMLENAEASILVRDRSAPAAAPPATLTAGQTQRVVQNGVTYDVVTDAQGHVVSAKAVR